MEEWLRRHFLTREDKRERKNHVKAGGRRSRIQQVPMLLWKAWETRAGVAWGFEVRLHLVFTPEKWPAVCRGPCVESILSVKAGYCEGHRRDGGTKKVVLDSLAAQTKRLSLLCIYACHHDTLNSWTCPKEATHGVGQMMIHSIVQVFFWVKRKCKVLSQTRLCFRYLSGSTEDSPAWDRKWLEMELMPNPMSCSHGQAHRSGWLRQSREMLKVPFLPLIQWTLWSYVSAQDTFSL